MLYVLSSDQGHGQNREIPSRHESSNYSASQPVAKEHRCVSSCDTM